MPIAKILVIAPTEYNAGCEPGPQLPDLSVEVLAIRRCHDAEILTGFVRDLDVAKAVGEDDYDIIWFSCHGDEGGVYLSDGKLGLVAVSQYVRVGTATLCVLNTCASEEVARQIAINSRADVICTIAPIINHDAVRLGALLAEELAGSDSDDYYRAYEIVAPPGGIYRYYRSSDSHLIPSRSGRHYGEHDELHAALETIQDNQREMWMAVIRIRERQIGVLVVLVILVVTVAVLWWRVDADFRTLRNLVDK